MNTWQMIRELTESKKDSGNLSYGQIDEDEGIFICGLNPDDGSIEFWFYSFIDEKLEKNPIIYNEMNWNELPAEKAKKYLGVHLNDNSPTDGRIRNHGRSEEKGSYQMADGDEKEQLISHIEDVVALYGLKIMDGDHDCIIVRESNTDKDFEIRVTQLI